jgi:hypothetical protein
LGTVVNLFGRAPVALVSAALGLTLGSCARPVPTGGRAADIQEIERTYARTRDLRDQIDVTRSRGAEATPQGVSLADLVDRYRAARTELVAALADGAPAPAAGPDARALEVMRRTLARELVEEEPTPTPAGAEPAPDCRYDPEEVASGPDGEAALSERIYACFAQAAGSLRFEGEELDRLTVFGRLPLTDEPSRREALWRALAPIWESVDGDGEGRSPYRTLVGKRVARMRSEGEELGGSLRLIGLEPAQMESWLTSALERWRETTPEGAIDAWDFAHQAGAASRALSSAIPVSSLREVNDRFYRELGADPAALDVRYDLAPRAGKDPVAFTTFGRRPRQGGPPGEPWVFASYRIGGLDNLAELLHETGHAIHIAAIRTRPAFADWPDSDIFTEAIADLASLELCEPAWQQRYLGRSAPGEAGIRAKYAGVVMDMAWALFELRVHREPERDPNAIWTGITQRYFRIRPQPDLAWWAVRGQLIDSPGYMMNYAAGAILVADLRAAMRERHGRFDAGDPDWYARVSEQLYRFGLERPSVQVIEDFLGRPVSPQALLDDMRRAGSGS